MENIFHAQLIATRDAYGKALARVGEKNKNIVVLEADLSKSTKTEIFAKKFPDRFFQMGIAEQDMVDTAAGFATCGKIAFCSTFAIFGSRGWEQIRNVVARGHLKVALCFTHAGLSVGEDGASAQANEDIAIFRAIPGIKIIVPADGVETESAVEWIADHIDGTVYMRLGREKSPVVLDKSYKFQLGKAVTLREGNDVAIIACGIMVPMALEAADKLAAEGIKTRVLDMATIKPIDRDAIVEAAEATGAFVTAEEHQVNGGLGGAVAEVLALNHPVPLEMVAVKDTYGESGTPDELLEKYGLTVDAIVDAARKATARKSGKA